MKIQPEHFQILKDGIAYLAPEAVRAARASYRADPRIKDVELALRWACLRASGQMTFLTQTLYRYLNDDHVDTALRAIMAEVHPVPKEPGEVA